MPFFPSPNGYHIHYREQGQGPLLVILPGNTSSSNLHEILGDIQFFAESGFQAVSMDYAGTGLSNRLPRPWPLDWFKNNAADCAALIEHLGEEKATLVGTSGGAIVALWAAILFPDRVQEVIADSEAKFYPSGSFDHLLEERGQKTEGQIRFWSDAHGADWEEVVAADTELLMSIDAHFTPLGGWEVHEGHLGQIRCPVMLSCSLTDDLIPGVGPQMLQMAGEVKNCWFFSVNGGSHPLMWSQPAAFRRAALAFLSRA